MVATGKQKAAKPNTSREAAATRATFEQLVFLAVAELARSDANGPKPITEDRIIERFAELSTLAGKKLPKNYQSKARKLLEKLKRRELSVPHQLPSGPAHALSPLGRRM
ncbi:hypothetical protein QCA50_010473 [Cerrena zonata]|uniref:Uncharacterized protein n=1 Tax=Cerrena zonata TaxID=2478898 RepID=A0AAW0G8F7_9APHY